ncbi:MAG: hypothetical protein ACRDDX_10575 [Cellulosilyticaceae bacterium]
MRSIKLDVGTMNHINAISASSDQVLEDVAHRLTTRKGDYIFDRSIGVDYDIVFGKSHDTEQKIEHLKAVILSNTSVERVEILNYAIDVTTRKMAIAYRLHLASGEETKGGVDIGD